MKDFKRVEWGDEIWVGEFFADKVRLYYVTDAWRTNPQYVLPAYEVKVIESTTEDKRVVVWDKNNDPWLKSNGMWIFEDFALTFDDLDDRFGPLTDLPQHEVRLREERETEIIKLRAEVNELRSLKSVMREIHEMSDPDEF